ncbi:MAG: hypothetical protein AAF264_02585, partial [Pseudomonadota bacterium]
MLDQLASEYGLDVFAHGSTIYISNRSEATLRLVRLGELTEARATAAIEAAGIAFAEEDMRSAGDGTAFTLSGPPRKLALAEAVVESLPPLLSASGLSVRTVRVRRGLAVADEPVGANRPPVQP